MLMSKVTRSNNLISYVEIRTNDRFPYLLMPVDAGSYTRIFGLTQDLFDITKLPFNWIVA